MDILHSERSAEQAQTMQRYYRLQSKIYDATRWTFLFGRKRIIRELPVLEETAALEILEVGCGTGYNLKRLALRFPNARLTGMDVSADMLERSASRTAQWADRITLLEKPYGEENLSFHGKFDLILFSYSPFSKKLLSYIFYRISIKRADSHHRYFVCGVSLKTLYFCFKSTDFFCCKYFCVIIYIGIWLFRYTESHRQKWNKQNQKI